ncbi:MAG: ribonucleotide reductase N-terminal alpha domain-containing protein [Ferroplasma sp.]|uniref:ATP cone domain-containing protein n=1 Tax=Ferroplasma sp. TaxID=2591003 RepID=UPI002815753E|nr:ATP cone domain-containing protein [Ferroplasma sp.]WMT51787.1 MAG: ribonucleotide reductase N-terminal alpha domain-containing protein [Ferroplasma sp.]
MINVLNNVIKRDGSSVPFDKKKIAMAIFKAMLSVKTGSMEEANKLADYVTKELEGMGKEPTVETIQDTVENVLMTHKINGTSYISVAKAYILYREKRNTVRQEKEFLGVKDDLKLSVNAVKVLEARYLFKDSDGKIIETPKQMFHRVAVHLGIIQGLYDYISYRKTGKLPENGTVYSGITKTQDEELRRAFNELRQEKSVDGTYEEFLDFMQTKKTMVNYWIDKFETMMTKLEYVPNSPTLMNAGGPLGQLSACFVLPVDDSIDSIFDTLKATAEIHKSGGGTGFSFTRLRASDDIVASTKGVASGPVSFMRIFDVTTDVIKQGGKRRGANMGILNYNHPNIMDFITSKDAENKILSNFNISVGVNDEFFEKLDNDEYIDLINPRDGKVMNRVKASTLWNSIINHAWTTGDPGMIFLDEINKKNPVKNIGYIESTNPCVTGDTRIYTSEGIKTAKQLYDEGESLNVKIDGRFGGSFKQSSNVIYTGFKDVYRITTSEGFDITVTGDHKIYSEERGWIEALKLKVGEKIRILNEGGSFGPHGNLEEGRVLGWLVGDGHVNRGNNNERAALSFYDQDRVFAPEFESYVNNIIRPSINNRDYHVGMVNIESRNCITIASERLKEFAATYDLVEEKLKVPDNVFAGTMEMQKGFLQALFEADGTVLKAGKSRYAIRLGSISLDLLKQVQTLLLNFGIFSTIYQSRKKAGIKMLPDGSRNMRLYTVHDFHELNISGKDLVSYANLIGFISERKNARLNEIIKSYTRGPYKTSFIARINTIEYSGKSDVYDLVEPSTHSFVANGIVVHNCGEQPLLPYESCNLGSINLAKFVENGTFNYDRYRNTIDVATRFLENVVDANKFPVESIKNMTRKTRKIGLGIMGFADALIMLGIPYNSNEALEFGEKVMKTLNDESHLESQRLAEERGVFPGWYGSEYEEKGIKMRNSTTTTIAPTGTISIIAGCSSSIEPLFALAFVRHVLNGQELLEVNPLLEDALKSRNLFSQEIMEKIAETGKLGNLDLPEDIKKLFVTAQEIDPDWHVLMQATFQKYCDSGVSKTINLPFEATPDDIAKSYRLAKELHCKGITVYRDRSKSQQVLYAGTGQKKSDEEKKIDLTMKMPDKLLKLDATFDPACPTGKCDL